MKNENKNFCTLVQNTEVQIQETYLDNTRLVEDKEKLRKHFFSMRANFAPGERISAGKKISCELRNLPCIISADAVAAFYPMRFEPDIWAFILFMSESGKKIFLPRFDKNTGEYEMAEFLNEKSLVAGKFGIPEPPPKAKKAEKSELETIPWLVPGIAFDRFGNRLGHGLGIFDRLLNYARGCKIGICFDFQLSNMLPHAPGDERMDCIVTENRILYANLPSA